jgi:RNA polymerase sigma-70 factor, ECF subfamily
MALLVRTQAGSDDRHPLETLLPLIDGPLHADEGGVEASKIPEERPSISAPVPDTQDEHRDRAAYETTLIASAADGDADAFEELYRTHVAGVARHVRLRLGRADEDAVAEVFVRAWAGISSYRDLGRPFGAWLFGIARHVIADEFRARSRTIPVADPPERAVEPMTAELLELREAIDRLPEDQRQVIELRYLAGLTNDEVAAAMETSPSAVNTKRWRALLVLRDVLKDAP